MALNNREKAIFELLLDAKGFNDGLDRARKKTEGLGGGAKGATEQTGQLNDKLKSAANVVGQTATAMGGLNTSMMGVAGASNNVVGGIGTLAGAFAGGGALALGMAATTFAIGTVVDRLSKAKKEATATAQKLRTELTKSFEGLEKAVEDANKELRNFGLRSDQREALDAEQALLDATLQKEKVESQVTAQKAAQARLQAEIREEAERIGQSEGTRGGGRLAQLRAEAIAIKKQIDADETALIVAGNTVKAETKRFEAKQKLIELIEEQERKENAASKAASSRQQTKVAEVEAVDEAEEERQRKLDLWHQRALGRADAQIAADRQYVDQVQANADQTLDILTMAEREREEIAKRDAENRIRLEEEVTRKKKEEADKQVAYVTAALDLGLSASLDLIEAVVAGEERAFERFAVQILKQAGAQIWGIGMSTFQAGLSKLLISEGTRGHAEVGLGVAQMSLGASMGFAGAVGGGLLSRASAANAGGGVGILGDRPTAGVNAGRSGRPNSRGAAIADGGGSATYIFNAPIYGDQNRAARNTAALQRRARNDLLERVN